MNNVEMLVGEILKEITYKTSRSSGAGGQHVNKVETRVTLIWDITSSNLLGEDEKSSLMQKLKTYLNKEGVFQLHDGSSRSQLMNKEKATIKFKALIRKALTKKKVRKPTKPSKESKQKRRKAKEMKSQKKENRQKVRRDH